MLFQTIERGPCTGDAVVTPHHALSWPGLRERVAVLREQWRPLQNQRVGLAVPADADGLAAMAALDALHAEVTLIDPSISREGRQGLADRLGWHSCLTPPDGPHAEWIVHAYRESTASSGAGVTILTSGTEGQPKAVGHTWDSLFRPVRVSQDLAQSRWLLAFRLYLYAGLQVIAQGMASGGCLVIPGPDLPAEDTLGLLRRAGVTHASATPSYWRWLLLFSDTQGWRDLPLRQVTLGGEAVDQAILDRLRAVVPQARIVHIYATTELGRCFSVTDGQAGFPLDYLRPDAFPDVKLKVESDELFVQSRHGGQLDPGGLPATVGAWRGTGDLVEIVGDRVLFCGRRGDVINVGGNKVHPLRVEDVVRAVAGVRDVLVLGKPSSIAGHLVTCQIVLDDPQEADRVRQAVLNACQQRLQRHEVPRMIEFVDRIALTSAGKRTRLQR